MNILLTALHPVGGIRTYLRYVYSHSVFQGCCFTLIGPDEGLVAFLDEFIPKERIKVIATKGALDFILTTRKQLQTGRYSFVHSHGFSAGTLTELAKTGYKSTHLMTAHDVFTSRQFNGLLGKIKQAVISFSFKRLDLIHTVTKDANENFLEFFPETDSNKLRYIAHGIDAERFQNATARNFKKELGLADDCILIGFFGRFMGQKGFRILVAAVKILESDNEFANIKVLTFGWGGFIREDYAYISEQGLQNQFIQMPSTNDMPAAIKGVDVVAMPSRWEACGLLGMEALCCGTPIVGTNCIGLREVLENSPALSIEVDNIQALANKLKASLSLKQSFIDYVPKAVERFSVVNAAQGMRDLYTEINIEALK